MKLIFKLFCLVSLSVFMLSCDGGGDSNESASNDTNNGEPVVVVEDGEIIKQFVLRVTKDASGPFITPSHTVGDTIVITVTTTSFKIDDVSYIYEQERFEEVDKFDGYRFFGADLGQNGFGFISISNINSNRFVLSKTFEDKEYFIQGIVVGISRP